MGFKRNDAQQMDLINDSFLKTSDRTKRIVENSWAKHFYEIIFSSINEERFEVLYSNNSATRPNTPANIMIGVLILKELFTLTDDELLESVICDVRFQYALGTTSFKEQPLSDRSFSRFRERLVSYYEQTGIDLVKEEMEYLADSFCSFFDLQPTMKRMDSLLVASSCRKLNRFALFYKCVSNLAKEIDKSGAVELLAGKELYLSKNYFNRAIMYKKHQDIEEDWEKCVNDGLLFLEETTEKLSENTHYKNLMRLFEEQLTFEGEKPKLLSIRKVSPDSLQNPSDPDASYKKKNRKSYIGYVANIVETFDEKLSLITSYDFEKNTVSDYQFIYQFIEHWDREKPCQLITDGGYGSEDVFKKAEEKNIDLCTTALRGIDPNPWEADFVFDEKTHALVSCPQGYKPEKSKYYPYLDQSRSTFNKILCKMCPFFDQCISKEQKKTVVVIKSEKSVFRAQQIKRMETKEFKKLAKLRNGIEAIPSLLRRRYHVDSMPFRGLVRTKICFGFKLGAINAKRIIKRQKDKKKRIVENIKTVNLMIKINFYLTD
ncbi:transposase [Enterococcus hulanensis]|uniref:transposase n=1 Tax=Enterococcus hulanensis TaxID=2559929 RepID=UPI001A9346FF|nr:transposase [Enterococcus hulanensis]MBO0413874.1 transposase [Enterococcus hulanensis]